MAGMIPLCCIVILCVYVLKLWSRERKRQSDRSTSANILMTAPPMNVIDVNGGHGHDMISDVGTAGDGAICKDLEDEFADIIMPQTIGHGDAVVSADVACVHDHDIDGLLRTDIDTNDDIEIRDDEDEEEEDSTTAR